MNGSKSDRWQAPDTMRAIAAVLLGAWLAACGGSDGRPGTLATAQLPPPGGGFGAFTHCLTDEHTGVDALAGCGGPGVICAGYFDGTTVHDLAPLTAGGWPSWSPDGLRLAFHRTSERSAQNINQSIYVVNADGTGEMWLADGRQPSWSADGQRIAFMRSDGVAAINADGTGETILFEDDTPGGDSTYAPAWSPDGQRIAFVDWPDMQPLEAIYVMNADGTDWRRVTPTLGEQFPESYPAWSPSGDRLAFVLRFYREIMTVDAAGAVPSSVVHGEPEFSRPAWAPDGARVAYTSNSAFVHPFDCKPDAAIRLVDVAGGPRRLIVRNAREPAWSPDGARIAFVTVGSGAAYRPPGDFLPAPEEADAYVGESPTSFGSIGRYLLFDDGTFGLEILLAHSNSIGYSGRYTRDGGHLEFQFDGDDRWRATGLLVGSRLTVNYNLIMLLSDFEDGEFVLEGG